MHKYWDRFLQPRPWHSWYETALWPRTLTRKEEPLAKQYTGFEHLDLQQYGSLWPSKSITMPREVAEILRREDRQRLWDFADQFKLLPGRPEDNENFDFWRGYLKDMQRLHRRHVGFLVSSDLPMGHQISEALNFLQGLEGKDPEDKAQAIAEAMELQPLVLHFLPVLDNRTLLALFDMEPPFFPKESTLKGTAAFVEQLRVFTPTQWTRY